MIGEYMKHKYGPKYPVVELTEAEFIDALVAAGFTREKSQRCATVSKALGAMVLVGNRNLMVKGATSGN